MNDSLFAVICIRYAKIFCCKIGRNQQIVFVDVPVLYHNRRCGKTSFLSIGVGILFVLVKDDFIFSVSQRKFTCSAAVASFYLWTVFDQGGIVRKHVYFLKLDSRRFAKRYGFSFLSKGKLFPGVLIVFSSITYGKSGAPDRRCHKKAA